MINVLSLLLCCKINFTTAYFFSGELVEKIEKIAQICNLKTDARNFFYNVISLDNIFSFFWYIIL